MAQTTQLQTSIVIPTYNRPWKLQRAVRYYAQHGIPIFVADGSPSPCTLPLEGDVSYFQLPSLEAIERISKVIDKTSTPYACIAADDDFISPNFLENACRIMDSDRSISTVFGRCYSFEEKKPAKWREIYGYARSVDQDDFRDRLSSFFGRYYPIFYAPTRTNLIKETFDSLPRLPIKYSNMMELLHGARLATAGKILVLNNFYLARESAVVYMTGLLYPRVQEILKESPDLCVTANNLLARWTGSSEDEIFSKYIMKPYDECCSGMRKKSIPSKIKAKVRDLLGEDRTDKLKKILPFLVKKPIFKAASDFEFENFLLEIERIVLRSLQDEERAITEGEFRCASS